MKKAALFLLPILLAVTCLLGGFGCSKREKERTGYEINAEYKPSDEMITGTVKVDFYNGYDAEFTCLQFSLYPNAYRQGALYSPVGYDVGMEAYYGGTSFGEITVSSVLGASGYEVGGTDKNVLYVYLEKPLAPEQRVTVDIGFSTRLAKVNHSLGISKSAVNFAGAFPVLCAYVDGGFVECVPSDVGVAHFSECADYTLRLTAPKEYALAVTGSVTEEKTLESKKRYTVSATKVREMAFCLAKNYTVQQAKTGKTVVEYAYYKDKNAREILALATNVITYFSSVFGEYPYDAFRLAQTTLVGAQADGSGLCMLPEKWTDAERVKGEVAVSIVRAIADGWWYSAVGANRMEYPWLVEGLSAYSAALFFGQYDGYDVTKASEIDGATARYKTYKDAYQKALGWVDTRMNRPLSTFLNAYEYQSVSVDKAVVMFAELEKSIGQKKLLAGLRKYYSDNLYGCSTPSHLVGGFEKIGLSLHGFFDGYTEGKGTF